MPATIKAEEKALHRIFSDDYLFTIPPYQRPYSWTIEEAGELLEDISDAALDANALDDLAPYFLGSIVLIKEPDVAAADVVDGQQRLTTLTILLAALRDLTDDEGQKRDIDIFIKQSGNQMLGIQDEYRLKVRQRDREFFIKNIQNEANRPELNISALTDARRNMVRNFQFLTTEAEKLSADQRRKLVQFILRKCFLVAVEASDRNSAFRVFSVMNDRGLDLAPTDILKADIIGMMPQADQDRYNDTWESTEDYLGRTSFSDLMSHIRMIHRKQKLKDTVVEEVRRYVQPQDRPAEFIDDELVPLATAYKALLDKNFRGSDLSQQINQHLKNLGLLDNSDWQPSAIVALSKYDADEARLEDFLRRLDRLAFYFYTIRSQATVNTRIRRYAQVLEALQQDADFYEEECAINLTKDEQYNWLEVLDEPLYGKHKIPRQILLRLDQAISDGLVEYQVSGTTIEHVCPQTIARGSEWENFFPRRRDHEDWVHCIGNLVLLSRKKNAAASNWDFDRKKTEYFSGNGVPSFALTAQVAAMDEWTFEILQDRQVEMIQHLARAWSLDEAIVEDWVNETYGDD